MSEIMKIIDERERKEEKKKGNKTKTERSKGVVQAMVKVWELNGVVARLS